MRGWLVGRRWRSDGLVGSLGIWGDEVWHGYDEIAWSGSFSAAYVLQYQLMFVVGSFLSGSFGSSVLRG